MPAHKLVSDVGLEGRVVEFENILLDALPKLLEFLQKGVDDRRTHQVTGAVATESILVSKLSGDPARLEAALGSLLGVKDDGIGREGLQDIVDAVLQYSVNTSAPGFLDKLYGAPLPPGILAELILGVLNTNLHVYQVSPVLSSIERRVSKDLASIFGLSGPRAGGINVQGGSASNMTSIVVARNSLFPATKIHGNNACGKTLVILTSAHGHYSIEKSAQALGFGSSSVIPVPVDEDGRMIPSELERLIQAARTDGKLPFYVNATAGSTVLGSFDPFVEIAAIAQRHNMWFHVDAAWGGGFVFSKRDSVRGRLRGVELADSIATNPHKMLGTPVTCSFLLGRDMRQFQAANTLKAGYLFHDDEIDDEDMQSQDVVNRVTEAAKNEGEWGEPCDLADLTLQCGRRGDALKLFFCWQYYGTQGYASMIDSAYDVACHMSHLVNKHPDLTPVLATGHDPSCFQICFYFTPAGQFMYGLDDSSAKLPGRLMVPRQDKTWTNEEATQHSVQSRLGRLNSKVTSRIAHALIPKGFMIDFAPALEGQVARGSFFRVVVNISSVKESVEILVRELVACGQAIVAEIEASGGYRGHGV